MTDILYSGVNVYNYPDINRSIRGEYIDYKFPLAIVPVSYTLRVFQDSTPVKWYILGRLKNGPWTVLNTQTFNDGASTLLPIDLNGTYTINQQVKIDTIRIHASISTGPSIKIKEFIVYDQYGKHIPFLVPFCTNTNSLYPSGSLNFDRLNHFSIDADLDTDFFAVGCDFIEIENGMIK